MKDNREKLKQFWDLLFSIGGIFGMYLWFVSISYPDPIIPAEWAVIPAIITPILGSTVVLLVAYSIIRHKKEIKKIYSKPKDVIEYAIEPNNSKSNILFLLFSFLLSMLLFFFLMIIPLEKSISSIPFVGNNLIILNEGVVEFSNLLNHVLTANDRGLALISTGVNFAKQLFVFSILLSFGPAYFFILRLLRIQYKNKETIHSIVQNKSNKKNSFPGSGSLVVFLFVISGLIVQKIIMNPNEVLDIETHWIPATLFLSAIPIVFLIFFQELMIKKLLKNN